MHAFLPTGHRQRQPGCLGAHNMCFAARVAWLGSDRLLVHGMGSETVGGGRDCEIELEGSVGGR